MRVLESLGSYETFETRQNSGDTKWTNFASYNLHDRTSQGINIVWHKSAPSLFVRLCYRIIEI